ncbi:retrovirus-related pol polyprotein from transposon TNT 1-94 [Tanacetum coccineum]
MLPLLSSQNLLGYVDGSMKPPTTSIPSTDGTSSPNTAYTTWKFHDQRVLLLLHSSLSEEAMAEVLGLQTGRYVWLAWSSPFDESLFPFTGASTGIQPVTLEFSNFYDPIHFSHAPSRTDVQHSSKEMKSVTHPMKPIHCPSCTKPSAPIIDTPPRVLLPTEDDLAHVSSTPLHQALFATKDPKGYKSAANNPQWLAAMEEEMLALHSNKTWTLIPRPKDSNVVGSKWVFRTKYHSGCAVYRLKARLVAQGFTQIPGLDYSHTFSPVVKVATVYIILALVVINKWPLHQLDVKNAFLTGHLSDIVFMEQPRGFVDIPIMFAALTKLYTV